MVLHQEVIALGAVVDDQATQIALDHVHDRRAGELGLLNVVDVVAADARHMQNLGHRHKNPAHDQNGNQDFGQGEASAVWVAKRA